jgi:hypothetical protein
MVIADSYINDSSDLLSLEGLLPRSYENAVACRPVARRRPADNNREMMFSALSARQQSNSSRETVFSVRFVPRYYKQNNWSIEWVVGQSPAGMNVWTEAKDVVGIRHQATTGEDRADWEDLVGVLVNCRACELAIALQLLVVAICKRSTNAITNPNLVYSHSYTWQQIPSGLLVKTIRLSSMEDRKVTRYALYHDLSWCVDSLVQL